MSRNIFKAKRDGLDSLVPVRGALMTDALPRGWQKVTIDEVCTFNPRHSRESSDTTIVSFVPMTAISETEPTFRNTEEYPLGEVRSGYTHFADGDVLFAKITPCMENGKAAIAANLKNGMGCGTTELIVMRPNERLLASYLYHFIHRPAYRKIAAMNFSGTAGQLRVPVSFVRQSEIPLPLPIEQRRIVAKLEKLLARIEASRRRLEKIPTLLKRLRQSILAAACDSDECIPLDDLCDGFDYGTAAKSEKSGTLPVLRMGNIQNGKLVWDDLVFTSDYDEIEKYSLLPNTVLFNRTNSPELVGKTAIYRGERPALFAGYLIRIRTGERLDPEYLNYCLNAPRFKEYCWSVKTDGVSQSNINATKLSEYKLPWVPISAQRQIVRRIEKLFKVADRIEERFQKVGMCLDNISQSILDKAFRGALVPQKPTDEIVLVKTSSSMKTIYVLGAGASRVRELGLPLGSELGWRYFRDCVGLYEEGSGAASDLAEKQKKFDIFQNKFLIFIENDFLPFIKRKYPKTYDKERLWRFKTISADAKRTLIGMGSDPIPDELPKCCCIDEILEWVIEKGDANQIRMMKQLIFCHLADCSISYYDGNNVNYKKFIASRILTKSPADVSVLSFNFDTLLHEEPSDGVVFDYVIGFDSVGDSRSKYYQDRKNYKLLKLHGSLDWWICPRCKRLTLRFWSVGEDWFGSMKCRDTDCGGVLEPMIIVPHQKKNDKRIRSLWAIARQKIETADKIVIIGYSFPSYDTEGRRLFSRKRDNVPVDVIVKPAEGTAKNRDDEEKKYRGIFPSGQLTMYWEGFEHYLQTST